MDSLISLDMAIAKLNIKLLSDLTSTREQSSKSNNWEWVTDSRGTNTQEIRDLVFTKNYPTLIFSEAAPPRVSGIIEWVYKQNDPKNWTAHKQHRHVKQHVCAALSKMWVGEKGEASRDRCCCCCRWALAIQPHAGSQK